jgi:hypothetical protein
VVVGRHPERDRWLDEFEEPEGFELVPRQPSPLNPLQKKTVIRVKPVRDGDELVGLCTSEAKSELPKTVPFVRSRNNV